MHAREIDVHPSRDRGPGLGPSPPRL